MPQKIAIHLQINGVESMVAGTLLAHTFSRDFELKFLHMRGFSLQFLDNQPENCSLSCISAFAYAHGHRTRGARAP